MTESRLRWLRTAVCTRKVQRSREDAMRTAARMRARGLRQTAYRCPFCAGDEPERGWHIGRPPQMRTLRAIAEYLRDRHAGAASR